MLTRAINLFFPIKPEETRKFCLLAATGFFIVGAYWLLRLLKNTIFYTVAFPVELGWAAKQGGIFQPIAKTWSPLVVLVVVLIYSKLVDLFKKHQLFYIFCTFYGLLFAGIASIVMVKEVYGAQAVGKNLLALTGWVTYFSVETFGSLVVALFWSFSNSISTTEAAKGGFPFIIACMQIGAIGGSVLCLFTEHVGALWPFLFLTAFFMFMIVGIMYYFMLTTPAEDLVGNKAAAATEKKKDGFFEGFISGLTLLFTRPYLLGVLILSTFYEVCMQIMDYQLHMQALDTEAYKSPVAFNRFEGMLGASANTLSFLIALLGTSYLIKRLGIRVSLTLYPIVFAITLCSLLAFFYTNPSPLSLLWATFGAFMVVKALSYAVNNPLKEMMYIPTSKDAKFKSKGWIDMFGSRFAKGSGAQINDLFKHNLGELMVYGTFFSFGLIGIWLAAAFYVGRKNQQLIHDGKIIE
jgi:AAA family ATP:ADP antiporter